MGGADLTALERAILSALVYYPALADVFTERGVVDQLSGALGSCVREFLEAKGHSSLCWVDQVEVPPGDELIVRQDLLRNLAKWFSIRATDAQLLAEDLDAASRGTARDCVEQMRQARPTARRRTGAGVR